MLPAPQIDGLIKQGKLIPGGRVDVAKSGIGVAVRAGAPKIDISSAEGIKKALLAAKTIAYSTGPSGVHIETLIRQWGLADQLKSKIVPPRPNVPIGQVVASGDAEIGFQQVSELLPVKGIDYLGPLPPDIQEITVFSAGVHKSAGAADAGRALLKFLTAPEAAPIIKKTGMEAGLSGSAAQDWRSFRVRARAPRNDARLRKRLSTVVEFLMLPECAFLGGALVHEPILPFAGIAVFTNRRVERHVAAEATVHIDHILLGYSHAFGDLLHLVGAQIAPPARKSCSWPCAG
jgi:molybdate transport system substrate-binding protein